MKKEQLMRRFGIKLIDALIQYIAEQLGKTEQEVVDGIVDKLMDSEGKSKISDYDWIREFEEETKQ